MKRVSNINYNININHIWKYYNNQIILRDISFEIASGSALCVTGPSGAGKTTLLRILLNLEQPDRGIISPIKLRWSAAFQEDRLLEHLDAENNLKFALGRDYHASESAELLNLLGLSETGRKKTRDFSGGMKRRLALARALLSRSDAVALDEPFTGLDITSRRACLDAIRRYQNHRTVILVTHDRTDAAALGAEIFNLTDKDP